MCEKRTELADIICHLITAIADVLKRMDVNTTWIKDTYNL